MDIFDAITLIGGLSFFLYGMRIMGDGLRSSSSGALKNFMNKVTNSPVKGFALGLGVTALIQSSKATIVLCSGLVGAGIINLTQSLGIVLGANVGTTVTGQIIRLMDIQGDAGSLLNFFKPATLGPLAAVIGIILIMFIKKKNFDTYGTIAMGFAILFAGLISMTDSVSSLSESDQFAGLFIKFSDTPILGFLIGAVVTMIIQSSSAAVGILQALSVTGAINFGNIAPILLGIYIGDAVTTGIVCSIGAKADAKRTGMVQVLVNLAQIILLTSLILIGKNTGLLNNIWDKAMNTGAIANMHTVFKLGCCIVLLPLTNFFERLSIRIIKDDAIEEDPHSADYALFDTNLYRSPGVALSSAFKAVSKMTNVAFDGIDISINALTNFTKEKYDVIEDSEDYIDHMTDLATNYLSHISSLVRITKEKHLISYYLKSVSELERISDLSMNLMEKAKELKEKDLCFSDSAIKELNLLCAPLKEITDFTQKAIADCDYEAAKKIEPLEEVIDQMVDSLRDFHLNRLRDGLCNIDAGYIFLDMLVNIERISDLCSNLGIYTLALFGDADAKMEHEYVKKLLKGDDPEYTKAVNDAVSKYMGQLTEIESTF